MLGFRGNGRVLCGRVRRKLRKGVKNGILFVVRVREVY